MSAKTVGGPKEFKFQTILEAKCEEGMQTCQLEIQAERSPINNEQQKWTLKAQAEMVMPENVENNEEFNEEEDENKMKNNLFSCKANSNYTNLKPATRDVFERALELVKSKYFWNTKSQLIGQSREGNPANGEAYLNIVIDPITQKHANMTVKTPEQLIRFQQIELPIQMRPFPLLKQQNVYQNIQSFGQFFTRQEVESRAECSIDGQTVETFEGNNYQQQLIQYNNQKNDLIINLEKLAVRFNGFKVWIKISSDYKNTQCGLCGHYDDASNDENELLMANNEIGKKWKRK
uniref:VWFD domain-containing protein n=1 Tax=Meloidogyne javanica TaxID=6303 RepID=A0A915LRA7_MELJA